jgi:hypothetical protein
MPSHLLFGFVALLQALWFNLVLAFGVINAPQNMEGDGHLFLQDL